MKKIYHVLLCVFYVLHISLVISMEPDSIPVVPGIESHQPYDQNLADHLEKKIGYLFKNNDALENKEKNIITTKVNLDTQIFSVQTALSVKRKQLIENIECVFKEDIPTQAQLKRVTQGSYPCFICFNNYLKKNNGTILPEEYALCCFFNLHVQRDHQYVEHGHKKVSKKIPSACLSYCREHCPGISSQSLNKGRTHVLHHLILHKVKKLVIKPRYAARFWDHLFHP